MTPSESLGASPKLLRSSVDVFVHISLIAILAVWSFRIFKPFLVPVVWGVILAVALFPLFTILVRLLGGRMKLAGFLFTVVTLGLILYPTYQLSDSFVGSVSRVAAGLEAGTVKVPPPPSGVQDWPVFGDRLYAVWGDASSNLDALLERMRPQIRTAGFAVLGLVASMAKGMLQTIVAILIATYAMANAGRGRAGARALLGRIGGERGSDLADMAAATIRSVAQGVVGVALIQAFLAGLGMALMGIPGWGVWTVLVLVLAVVQLPVLLVVGPAIIYVFTTDASTVLAVIFTVYGVLVSVSDAFLKPLFLGRGLDIPMPVILIGAIGGVMLSGIIGLFVGAVVLAIAYQLFGAWMGFVDAAESAD
ncbi:MAG: AI-2E family transporter [Gemmatimonadota bacterium]